MVVDYDPLKEFRDPTPRSAVIGRRIDRRVKNEIDAIGKVK
jgi:hypothetical protein